MKWMISILLPLLFLACAEGDKNNASPVLEADPATREMIDLLKTTYANIDANEVTYFKNSTKAEQFKAYIDRGISDPTDQLVTNVRYAMELLLSGQNEEAVVRFEALKRDFLKSGDKNNLSVANRFLAISYLRMGEQANCINKNDSESCLVPLSGGGIYSNKSPSLAAIEIYKEMLEANPADMESLYLLNLAYMTVGGYPQDVPPQYLIPPAAFESDATTTIFENRSNFTGVKTFGMAGGCATEDFDNDGFTDIITSAWGQNDYMHVLKNNGSKGFDDVSGQSNIGELIGGLNINHMDYNNDGLLDVFVLRGGWYMAQGRIPNSLLENKGQLQFSDVTRQRGIFSAWPTQTATWADFNLDGWIDVFIGNESSSKINAPSELFINSNGNFSEVSAAVGLANLYGMVKGVASGDIDNDGDPDLYISISGADNLLFRNDFDGETLSFTNITAEAGAEGPLGGFPTWMFDFDNDGHLDIMAAPYDFAKQDLAGYFARKLLGASDGVSQIFLLKNNGNGTFTNVAPQMGLDDPIYAMGSNFGDIDNDGYLDFYLGTGAPSLTSVVPNKMYRNNEGRNFQDVTTSARVGHIQKGHGVSFADMDNDGDQDIFHVLGGAYEGDVYWDALFINKLGEGNSWINVKCIGSKSNRAAIGARIKLTCRMTDGSERSIYRDVNTGGSFGSSTLEQEIGLGKAAAILSMEISWPNKEKSSDTYTNLPLNSFITVTEGKPGFEKRDKKKIAL